MYYSNSTSGGRRTGRYSMIFVEYSISRCSCLTNRIYVIISFAFVASTACTGGDGGCQMHCVNFVQDEEADEGVCKCGHQDIHHPMAGNDSNDTAYAPRCSILCCSLHFRGCVVWNTALMPCCSFPHE